jgi:hypothetical protein
MEQVVDFVKAEVSILLSLILGAILVVLRDRLAYHLKRLHNIDRTIDYLTKDAEERFPEKGSGEIKKDYVKEELSKSLKEKGVGLLKRALIFGVGRVGTSIENSVKNKINIFKK